MVNIRVQQKFTLIT